MMNMRAIATDPLLVVPIHRGTNKESNLQVRFSVNGDFILTMEQQNLFKGRDKRQRGWFWMDNEYLNGYAKIFGPVGTAIYVDLCRHANNDTQKCFPAMDLIAKELGISRNTVSKYIKLFEKHHLISIEKERDYKTKKWINNVYTLLDKTCWDSHAQIVGMDSHAQMTNEPCTNDSKSHAQQLGNKETNINKTNIKETNISEHSSDEITEIIKLFEAINPACKRYYGNITQRKACKDLIDTYGFDEISKVIAFLPKNNSTPFMPKANTPLQLWDKFQSIKDSWQQVKNKQLSKFKGLA